VGHIKLLTKGLLKTLPGLYSQEDNPDPMVVGKFFTPGTGWTWYAIEGSPIDQFGSFNSDKEKVDFLFFGLTSRIQVEQSFFLASEFKGLRIKYGLSVERDLSFQPARLSEIKKLCVFNR